MLEHAVHDDPQGAESPRSGATAPLTTFEGTTTLPRAAGDLIGKTLLGQFDVLRKLGQGEFGAVYLAEQRGIDRPAVIKVLHRGLAANRSAVRRFQREAKALARLDHHHLVKLYNFGELEDGTPFLAMEYGGERTLADMLREEGPLPPARVRHLGEQVCEALAEAHARGVVHRDLKPANLLVSDKDGADWVKIVDVGIAKLLQSPGEEIDVSALTREGSIVGTPAYFSPEQARGQLELDGRSDLYSLGVVLYEAVSGKRPFRGATLLELIRAHALERPAPLKKCGDPALEAVILRAMEKEPDRRFATALEMRDAIRLAEQPRFRSRWPIAAAVGSIALAIIAFLRMERAAPTGELVSRDPGAASLQEPRAVPEEPVMATPAVHTRSPDPLPATPRGGSDTSGEPGRRPQQKLATPRNATPIGKCTEVADSRPVPPVESGDGVLVVLAIPWAQVTVDGTPVGEAPCELRIRSGTYRMRFTHPELGEKQSTVEVVAGTRQVLQISLNE